MALTNNPNKSTRIEKQWNKEIDLRWGQFSLAIDKLPIDKLVLNIDDQEQFDIDQFMNSFSLLALQFLLDDGSGEWQNKYQTTAYERSAERAIEAAKASLSPEQIISIGAILGGAIGAALSLLPSNRNELNFLYKRANESLTKWVTSLISEVDNITRNSFNKVPKEDFIKSIKDRLKVSQSRAKTIATTEIAQASQRAVTTQAKIMGEVLGEEVNVRWITQMDSIVRHLHAGWHGEVFTTDEAETNFNISPWNCRCGLMPVIGQQSIKTKQRFTKERKLLLSTQRR